MELYDRPPYKNVVSLNIEGAVVDPGSDEYLDAAWELKERIRQKENVLKQRWGFFADSYRKARVHVLLVSQKLVGFAAVRQDGYLLFLAVDPEYRDRGLGRRLISQVAAEHEAVTCHARASNESALGFYRTMGFDVDRYIQNYYEDGGDAYYLRLGKQNLTDRLSELFK